MSMTSALKEMENVTYICFAGALDPLWQESDLAANPMHLASSSCSL